MAIPGISGAVGPGLAQVEHENFGLQLTQHVGHGVALDDAAAFDDGDVAAQILGLLEVMRGQNDGRSLVVDIAQELPHRAANLDIDAGGRLIQYQQLRFVHQRSSDHEAPLHAAGERAGDRMAALPQLQLLEIFLGSLLRERPRYAVEAGLVHHDREQRLEHVEIDLLRHDADAGLRHLELAIHVVAEDLDDAAGLVDQRGDDADDGGLAGAVRTEQREKIALRDLEIDAFERLDAVLVDLGELAKDEGVHRSRVD